MEEEKNVKTEIMKFSKGADENKKDDISNRDNLEKDFSDKKNTTNPNLPIVSIESEDSHTGLKSNPDSDVDSTDQNNNSNSSSSNNKKNSPISVFVTKLNTRINNVKNNYQRKQQNKMKNRLNQKNQTKFQEWVYEYIKAPFKRYLGLVEKEVRVLLRDKAAMLITYLIPIVVIVMLTANPDQQLISTNDSASNNTSRLDQATQLEIPRIGLIDQDNSEGFPNRDLSQELVAIFQARADAGYCELHITDNQTELEMMLGRGELNAFVIIPPLFEFNLSIHLPVILTFVLDSIDTLGLQGAQEVVDNVINEFRETNNFTGVFNVQKHNVNLPEKAQLFFASAPFLIPLVMFGIGCLTATQSIVSDIPKDRMVLTPTNKFEMMAAKVSANQIIMVGLGLIFLFASMMVGLEIRSSWFAYFIVLFIMALNSVLVGVAISAISKTPLSAFQYFIFLFIFQTVVLIFVDDPRILMWLPIHNFNRLILANVLRGQSFWSTRDSIGNIFLETFIVYLLSYLAFQHQKTML